MEQQIYTASDALRDPVDRDCEFPMDMHAVVIPSNREKMYGVLLTAQGKGPHPTVVLLHGFPGNENNFDIAHALRRIGFNVLTFHYRGTWGSEGEYSFGNMLEDIRSAYVFVEQGGCRDEFKIDSEKIFIGGNSLGGYGALRAFAEEPGFAGCIAIAPYDLGVIAQSIEASDVTRGVVEAYYRDCLESVRASGVEALFEEMRTGKDGLNMLNYADGLAGRSILLLGGSKDDVAPPQDHILPLYDRLDSVSIGMVKKVIVDTDHGFQDRRVDLTLTIAEWLLRMIHPV